MRKILSYKEYITESTKFTNEAKSDDEMDRILDKISSMGIDSLTPDEKKYLNGDKEEEVQEEEYNDFIDEEGNYIKPKKENFLLKVIDDASIEGDIKYKNVQVFDRNGKYMVDLHFCDLFQELENVNLVDTSEGAMEYDGRLNADELVNKLRQMGFNAVIG